MYGVSIEELRRGQAGAAARHGSEGEEICGPDGQHTGGECQQERNPRQRDLGHARATGLGNPLDRSDDRLIERRVERLHDLVDGGAETLLAPGASEAAFALRGVRH